MSGQITCLQLKYFVLPLCTLLLFTSVSCSNKGRPKEDIWTVKPPAKETPVEATSLVAPDPYRIRNRLFSFFERNKDLTEFDTTDNATADFWGHSGYTPSRVVAGHIFKDNQVHALIFYTDTAGTGMYVYRKEANSWRKIYADTTLPPHNLAPEFKDWNADGTKDIGISHRQDEDDINPILYCDLWLVDTNGRTVYPIKGFADIPNPKLRSDGHVKSISAYIYGSSTITEYYFQHYQLVQLYERTIKEE